MGLEHGDQSAEIDLLDRRREAWKRLENDLDRQKLAMMTREIGLSDVFGVAPDILSGQVRGRIVVKIG